MDNVITLIVPDRAPESEAVLLRRVLGLSTSALTYWDAHAMCRYANRAAFDWFGVAPEILEGSSFDSFAEVIGLTMHREYERAALRGEARAVVQAFRHPSGERVGLVRYLPDVQQGVAAGFVVQVSVTPAELRLEE